MTDKSRRGRLWGWLSPAFLFLALVPWAPAASTRYLNTHSAFFDPPGRVALDLGLTRFEDRGPYGAYSMIYSQVPVVMTTSLARNVQVALTLPVIWVENVLRPERSMPPAVGDLLFDLAFAHDEPEYDYREIFTFRTRIPDTSPNVAQNRRYNPVVDYEPTSTVRDYFPLARHNGEMALGWGLTKEVAGRLQVHLGFRYTYEFGTNETLTNFFAFQGVLVNSNDTSTFSNFDAFQGTTFSLFGIEKVVQRLFGWTDFKNPWADKANDHLELSLSIDTRIDLGYHFGQHPVHVALVPFAELFWVRRFSEESLAPGHLDLSAGVGIELPAQMKLTLALTKVLWREGAHPAQDGMHLGVSFLF